MVQRQIISGKISDVKSISQTEQNKDTRGCIYIWPWALLILKQSIYLTAINGFKYCTVLNSFLHVMVLHVSEEGYGCITKRIKVLIGVDNCGPPNIARLCPDVADLITSGGLKLFKLNFVHSDVTFQLQVS